MKSSEYPARLARLRAQIAKLKQQREGLDSAPVPKARALERVDELIADLASQVRITAEELTGQGYDAPSLCGDEALHLTVRDGIGFGRLDFTNVSATLAWLIPDIIRSRLVQAIEAFYADHPEGLAPADRRARGADLDAQLYELEIAEERMVLAAELAGFNVTRRPDADPRAILEA